MKQQILFTIYDIFEKWNKDLERACHRGCSACCTQNVTLTAIEAEAILRFIQAEGLTFWLAKKLASPRDYQPPKMTTNDFASACLNGQDKPVADHHNLSACPFLEEDLCKIYPVRPFSCRLFISQQACSAASPALVSDSYLEAATAVTQLVEHLGQQEYWGNMLDVLPALLDISEFREIADHFDSTLMIEARMRTLTARPLPGFLLSEEHINEVSPLLEKIFAAEIGGKKIEDILNGR